METKSGAPLTTPQDAVLCIDGVVDIIAKGIARTLHPAAFLRLVPTLAATTRRFQHATRQALQRWLKDALHTQLYRTYDLGALWLYVNHVDLRPDLERLVAAATQWLDARPQVEVSLREYQRHNRTWVPASPFIGGAYVLTSSFKEDAVTLSQRLLDLHRYHVEVYLLQLIQREKDEVTVRDAFRFHSGPFGGIHKRGDGWLACTNRLDDVGIPDHLTLHPPWKAQEKSIPTSDQFTCSLCHRIARGRGHNPDPVAQTGRCCDWCHQRVIAARAKGAE